VIRVLAGAWGGITKVVLARRFDDVVPGKIVLVKYAETGVPSAGTP
jgi:hypothetical protein